LIVQVEELAEKFPLALGKRLHLFLIFSENNENIITPFSRASHIQWLQHLAAAIVMDRDPSTPPQLHPTKCRQVLHKVR
jgi:hypothetical protein